MIWIVIIGALIALWFIKFAKASKNNVEYIQKLGGMKVVYKTLIGGIMEYHTAEVSREGAFNTVSVSGDFIDCVGGVNRGVWAVNIQHTFNVVHVSYRARIRLNGVEPIDKQWDFPIDMDQNRMVEIIKKEMNKTDIYGIYK